MTHLSFDTEYIHDYIHEMIQNIYMTHDARHVYDTDKGYRIYDTEYMIQNI